MTATPPFDPRRFESAALHYRAGRIPYPPRLIRRIAELVGLRESHRVLDLGCGPGQLAIAFSFFAGEVVGVDPEPQMLAVASHAAQGLAANVRFREGSSFDLDPALGRFRLVTMGRSFHWMDRADTLRKLDEMIDPGGAVALFGDHHLDVPENEWHREWRTVIDHYARDDAGRGRRREPSWLSHERVLLASPFAHLERISVIGRHVSNVASLIERARSMSSLSRERIGERLDDLERDLKTLLTRAASDGVLTEIIEWTVLSGRRD